MNYKIIKDEKLLKDFIDWLPELEPNEMFYVALFGRKKYNPIVISDKAQLKRFTSTKDMLFSKIKQLECEIGSYTQKNEVSIPQDALALYITPNPRDLYIASLNTIKEISEKIKKSVTDKSVRINPRALSMNAIHTSCTRKIYKDFDFDTNMKEEQLLEEVNSAINIDCVSVLKTRGGYHVLVELAKINDSYTKTWYKDITSILDCDVRGDNLIPVPGCTQGEFIPHFIK
jgi:hypothetical protein